MMKKAEGKMTFKISDIGRLLKNALLSILRGELLFKLNVDKLFPQIAYTFLLFALTILFSLLVDGRLEKVEANKSTIAELERLHAQRTFELVTLDRRSTVATILLEEGSEVTEPEKPAAVLK